MEARYRRLLQGMLMQTHRVYKMNSNAAEAIENILLLQAHMNRVRGAPVGHLNGDVFVNGDILLQLVGCPASVILWNMRGRPDVEMP